MGLLAIYIGLALSVSFLCSLLEATLLSLTPTFLESLENKRPKLGLLWRNFKSDIDKPLAAILSLNTIAHTIGAAGAGDLILKVKRTSLICLSIQMAMAIVVKAAPTLFL